ncbi:hypothetical protein [Microbacterium invictum]|uniref:Uncharacterized protein n=1 Tax=Microbacterium invictum TaxID=515415 RepID=A0AA40SS86_9MICO|nr:hypothetical protein [Microbacterium invictum]MBB4141294.1 hypothetical protein [Microbacterium invictum]
MNAATQPSEATVIVEQLARRFGEAVAARDWDAMRALFDDGEFSFKTTGLVNSTNYEGLGQQGPIKALQGWIPDDYQIEGVEQIVTDAFAARGRVGYRLRVRKPEGTFLLEQQAYVGQQDGRINYLRIMCGGYRPLDA